MKENQKYNHTLTQQGAFRKDRNALNRAEKQGVTDKDIINKMAEMHSNHNSAQAFSEAAGAVIHTRANMSKETPIFNALEAILKESRVLDINGQMI